VYSGSAVCTFSSKLEAVGRPCNQENDHVKRKFMKLEGIGKYPHITVKLCSGKKATTTSQPKSRANTLSDTRAMSVMVNNTLTSEEAEVGKDSDAVVTSSGTETVVDFGEVAVGSVVKKRIEITNVSPVSLYYNQ
jgi:DNA repair protein RadC